MKAWYLSTPRMTVLVEVNRQKVVTDAAPIVRVFIGQPLANLVRWMKKQGGLVVRGIMKKATITTRN